MHSIAIFGGTFDPVHQGHLQTSLNIQHYFKFDDYYFLPCKTPTLKSASLANSKQRLDMLKLAVKNYPEFKIDRREMDRDSPSYMTETLLSFRQEYPNDSITLIIGYDAFLSLPRWHQWENLIALANILVINRRQYQDNDLDKALELLIHSNQCKNPIDLLHVKSGKLAFFDAGNYDISSTDIRLDIKNRQHLADKIPPEVLEYIISHHLYI
jgi:nicotinate-nucleotide adenylyltransferase